MNFSEGKPTLDDLVLNLRSDFHQENHSFINKNLKNTQKYNKGSPIIINGKN